ncbi:MAG: branched-chain amino acid ABC transporter substrate-binding protein [Thermoleophilia bacterium]|nr:branched-chain amino acid ABC transporter substrate-binding protein [Thermoleophilia bacterium]
MTARKSVLAVLGLLVAALALVATGCGGGDDSKTLKIVSDLPLQGSNLVQSGQMVEAIEYVMELADNKAGDYTVEYESFDDAIASTGNWDEATCASNARSYADDDSIVINIGTYNSGCAAIEIPILNEAGLAMVSPANTYPGLTVSGSGTEAGEPDKYYPSGERNYLRVVAHDLFQGSADANFMKNDLGVKSVFILDDKELYGKGVADAFEGSAKEIGLGIAGHEGWDKDAPNYTALMTKIKATGADAIFIGGVSPNNGGQLVKDKVSVLGDNETVKLVVSDGFVLDSLFKDAGAENVNGAYGSAPTLPASQITGAGAEFLKGFQEKIGVDEDIQVYTLYAATAAQVALDAIARSDGTRADIIAQLFATNLTDAATGSMSFDANGDPAAGTEQLFLADGPKGTWVWNKALESTS